MKEKPRKHRAEMLNKAWNGSFPGQGLCVPCSQQHPLGNMGSSTQQVLKNYSLNTTSYYVICTYVPSTGLRVCHLCTPSIFTVIQVMLSSPFRDKETKAQRD